MNFVCSSQSYQIIVTPWFKKILFYIFHHGNGFPYHIHFYSNAFKLKSSIFYRISARKQIVIISFFWDQQSWLQKWMRMNHCKKRVSCWWMILWLHSPWIVWHHQLITSYKREPLFFSQSKIMPSEKGYVYLYSLQF